MTATHTNIPHYRQEPGLYLDNCLSVRIHTFNEDGTRTSSEPFQIHASERDSIERSLTPAQYLLTTTLGIFS